DSDAILHSPRRSASLTLRCHGIRQENYNDASIVAILNSTQLMTLIVSPNLLSELKNLSIQEGYMLKIENVLPPNFRVFLVREGFIFPGESWVCDSGYWLPESEVLKNGINSLLV
ncbi:hypothetical protein MBF91_18990, partial [Escherichia coli]|nr:hypothetical protein [Escherichia coli]